MPAQAVRQERVSRMSVMTREGVVVGDGGTLPEIGVPIYVRKPRDDSRSLSFNLAGVKDAYLQSLMTLDVLDMGMAFDGDSVFVEVTPRTKVSRWEPSEGTPEEKAARTYRSAFYEPGEIEMASRSLSAALNDVQRELADWLIRVGTKAGWKVNVYFI